MNRLLNIALITIALSVASCASKQKLKGEIPIINIDNKSELDRYVGQVITLKGMVTKSKVATIYGVDVKSAKPNLRGRMATATGLLEKRTIKPKDANRYSAGRGPGVYYRLKDPNTGQTVQVEAVR